MMRRLSIAATLVLLLDGAGKATAGLITGTAYEVTNEQATHATLAEIASLSSSTPQATFTTNQIDFDSRLNGNDSANYTYKTFLNSKGSVTTFDTLMNGFDKNATLSDGVNTGALFVFQGSAYFTNGEQFTVGHDDGLTFLVNGMTVLNDPGPTPPTDTTVPYNGPTGTFDWEIVYGECDGAPAVLHIVLPGGAPLTSTPEPTSLTMLGIGAFGLMGYTWRRRKLAAQATC